MKVIFLDFDGVLNSSKWFAANKQRITESTSLLTRGRAELDPESIQRVLSIIAATGAAVVISSSWRNLHTMAEISEMLPELAVHFVDKTPDLNKIDSDRDIGCWRGHEIAFWIQEFEKKNGQLDSFLILDDDSDMLPHQKTNFVQTNWEVGILDTHVEQAIKILGATHVPV